MGGQIKVIIQLLYFFEMQNVSILPLGAGCEVGRSCLILSINNKKIMLDCGLMINKEDSDSLPLFDRINPEQISMVIITHAHLDHCGALPYFLARYNYKRKVYMTKPTKDIYHYLVRDTAKVQRDKALFNNQQILDSLERIYPVQFGVETEEDGIKITPYVAGHIVGAAMFIIEVDGVKVLYTGDYSCEEDRYIMKAEIPQSNVDILIAESTFGIRVHESRRMREQKFQQYVHKIVKGGGKCLLPVFSAGRAQELLFILDEYWQQKVEDLGHIQIYYTVSLIDKCRNIYETYIDMLSKKIR